MSLRDLGELHAGQSSISSVKVIGQIVLKAISKCIEDKKVIWSSKHRFTPGKSRLTDLITFFDEMMVLVDGEGMLFTLTLERLSMVLPITAS